MPYNTRNLLLDEQDKPISQVNDDLLDAFQPVNGDGASMSVSRGKWYAVGAGATTTTIPMSSYSGLTMVLSQSIQSQIVGSTLTIKDGSNLVVAKVTAVSSAGVLTIDDTLSAAPAQGTFFMLTPPEQTQLMGTNTTIPTELSSNNVITQTLLSRQTLTGSSNITAITPPNGAIGVMIITSIYGVTGTFTTGQGLSISVYTGFAPGKQMYVVSSPVETTAMTNWGIVIHPNAATTGYTMADSRALAAPLGTSVEPHIFVSGTFTTGQGFDCEMDAIWLMR